MFYGAKPNTTNYKATGSSSLIYIIRTTYTMNVFNNIYIYIQVCILVIVYVLQIYKRRNILNYTHIPVSHYSATHITNIIQ